MSQIVAIERHLMTPFGEAEADHMWVSDSADVASEYECWILETGECWWFPQPLVRAVRSMSASRRGEPSEIALPDSLLHRYATHLLRHKRSPFYERARALVGETTAHLGSD